MRSYVNQSGIVKILDIQISDIEYQQESFISSSLDLYFDNYKFVVYKGDFIKYYQSNGKSEIGIYTEIGFNTIIKKDKDYLISVNSLILVNNNFEKSQIVPSRINGIGFRKEGDTVEWIEFI